MLRWLRITVVLLAVALAGCTVRDMLRSVAGGTNSDEARMNRLNPKNNVYIGRSDDGQ